MATPRNATTLRERQLTDEMERIRSTYSFNLGLLITEAFFRKPWKLPLLPFSFLKLNFDFLRNKQSLKKELTEHSLNLDANCLLLFCTSEEGLASLERCAVLAQQWLSEEKRKVVFISPLKEANQFAPKEALIYPITNPKQLKKEQRGEWNAQCEQLLANVLDTHLPANVLFDGPYPYRGVLNCIPLLEQTKWHWIRPDGIKDAAIAARSGNFTNIVEFGFGARNTVRLIKPSPSKMRTEVQQIVLDGRNYGQREGAKPNKLDLRGLIKKEVSVLSLDEWYEERGGVLKSRESGQLLAAILPPNLEAIAVMMERNVPTLCIYNDETSKTTLKALKQGAQRHPIMFSHESDSAQLKISIGTLMQEQQAMRTMSDSVQKTDWIAQIVSSG